MRVSTVNICGIDVYTVMCSLCISLGVMTLDKKPGVVTQQESVSENHLDNRLKGNKYKNKLQ